jgi:lysophospholipase L1-like esterase
MGVLFPIRDEFYLDLNEINYIRVRINEYNNIIRSIADEYSLALTDVHEYAQSLTDGFTYNGVSMSAKFVSGGAYSLDGIHMNPRGNALLANQFIKSINAKYNARIQQLNAMDFNATLFP